MTNTSFVHLQLHSEFSLLEGAVRIPRLLNHCEEENIQAIALTDNGNLYGAIDFYFGAKKRGINPILGTEVYFIEDMDVKSKLENVLFCCVKI